jgi:hypothetical protein
MRLLRFQHPIDARPADADRLGEVAARRLLKPATYRTLGISITWELDLR